MHQISITLLFTLLSGLLVHAVPMHVLAWDQSISKRDLSIASGIETVKADSILKMHHLQRSAPIKIPPKAKNLRLLVNDRKSAEGEPLSLALKIPEGMTRPLLLLLPDKKDPTGIKTIVIDDSPNNFKWGTIRFINMTSETLVFRHDKKNTLIGTGWKPVDVSPGGRARNMATSFYLRKDLKLPPIYSSIWKHRDDLRQIVFITSSKDKSRSLIDFKFLSENKAVVEAPKKPQ